MLNMIRTTKNTLEGVCGRKGVLLELVCFSFHLTHVIFSNKRFSMSESSGSVLGANTIRGHDVYFDIIDNDRIGFAPSDCDYLQLIGEEDDSLEDIETNKMEILQDDDYYEADDGGESIEKFNDKGLSDDIFVGGKTKNDETDGFELSPFVVVASLAISGLVGYTVFTLYKRATGGAKYSSELRSEHINDLHLDTEIENIPAIA